MSYTNPFGQPQGNAYFFINKIREALISEIVAINGYETHIANSNMKPINEIWHSIMEDEKKHYGLFLELIHHYDPYEYELYLKHKDIKIEIVPLQPYKPKYDEQIILNNVREDIKGELEAIILYEQLLLEIAIPSIREVIQYITDAEKGHVEHLTRFLLTYDLDPYDGLK